MFWIVSFFFFVPNIYANTDIYCGSGNDWFPDGAFSHTVTDPNRGMTTFDTTVDSIVVPYMNAKNVSTVYDNSHTVQPNSIRVTYVIRYVK